MERKERSHTTCEVYDHIVERSEKCPKLRAKVQEIGKHHAEGNEDKIKELTKELVEDELFDKSMEFAVGVDATGLLTIGKMCYHICKGDPKKVFQDALGGVRSFVIIKIIVAGACVGCRIF